jgi:hypothetical protein
MHIGLVKLVLPSSEAEAFTVTYMLTQDFLCWGSVSLRVLWLQHRSLHTRGVTSAHSGRQSGPSGQSVTGAVAVADHGRRQTVLAGACRLLWTPIPLGGHSVTCHKGLHWAASMPFGLLCLQVVVSYPAHTMHHSSWWLRQSPSQQQWLILAISLNKQPNMSSGILQYFLVLTGVANGSAENLSWSMALDGHLFSLHSCTRHNNMHQTLCQT